jgi:hypothetical protein
MELKLSFPEAPGSILSLLGNLSFSSMQGDRELRQSSPRSIGIASAKPPQKGIRICIG